MKRRKYGDCFRSRPRFEGKSGSHSDNHINKCSGKHNDKITRPVLLITMIVVVVVIREIVTIIRNDKYNNDDFTTLPQCFT